MASTSFLISNSVIRGAKSSAIPPPPSAARFTAGFVAFSKKNASLYEVLGVRSSATFQEIKFAYRQLARVLHPDVVAFGGGDHQTSSDDFMRVHAAYATLSDPEKRAVYDGSLFPRPQAVSVTQRWRNWETDQCW